MIRKMFTGLKRRPQKIFDKNETEKSRGENLFKNVANISKVK